MNRKQKQQLKDTLITAALTWTVITMLYGCLYILGGMV